MKNYSIWKDGINILDFPKLSSDISTDVLIIGGGMTGINTYYQLRKSSLEVVLVEQNKIGMGVTVNSTGKLTYLQGNLLEKIQKNFDDRLASLYLESQQEAIKMAVDIINKHEIECDLMEVSSFVYGNSSSERNKLNELRSFLEKNKIKVIEGINDLVEYQDMIGVEDTYVFHPLKFIYGLIDKGNLNNIYEYTSIRDIRREGSEYVCFTDDGCKIKAKWVVLGLHYPYFTLPYLFPVKGSLEKSYLSACKYKENNISLIRYDSPVISIRGYQDYLLYLSNSHNVGSKVDDKKHYSELVSRLKKLELEPEYLWSNMDIMTNDGLSFIGEIKDKLLLGTGYNTWGMTNGILAGRILADIILGKKNKYISLFDPKRINKNMIVGGLLDGIYNVSGYINGYLTDSKKIEYRSVDGKEIAIYRDKNGEHKVYTKCPHLGCRLIFNELEKTWDCPCHASRFDLDGKCISGPSNQDIGVESSYK